MRTRTRAARRAWWTRTPTPRTRVRACVRACVLLGGAARGGAACHAGAEKLLRQRVSRPNLDVKPVVAETTGTRWQQQTLTERLRVPGTEASSTLHGPGLCILTTTLDGGVRSPPFVTTEEQAHEGWWPPRVGDAELGLGPRSGWSAAHSSKRDVCPSALLRPRVLLAALGPLPPPALLAPRSSTASGHQPLGHSRGGWDAWSPHPPAPWPRPALPGQLFKGVATWQHFPPWDVSLPLATGH